MNGLGTAAVLNTGISNTNVPKFTSGVADDDFLRVAGTDIEGRSASEVLSDIAAMPLAGGTFTGDVIFDSVGALLFDKSNKSLKFGDNYKAKFGASDDLQIYHSTVTNSSYIQDAGSGNLLIQASGVYINNTSGSSIITADTAGAANLRYQGTSGYTGTKLSTNGYGVTVTGALNADSATLTGGISIADQYDLTGDSSRVTSTSAANISYVSASTYTGGKFVITAHDHVTGARQISELLVIRDSAGGTAVGTEYGQIYTNSSIATYTADVHSGLLRLLASGATTNATTYQVAKTLMKD